MDVIKVEKRDEQAKANRLRRSGLVPCCVYGGDLEGRPAGTVLSVKDIPEFQSEKVELQIDSDSMVLRIVDRKHAASDAE